MIYLPTGIRPDRAGGFEALSDARDSTVVVLGLLTTKSNALESGAGVLARIDEATRHPTETTPNPLKVRGHSGVLRHHTRGRGGI